MAPAPKNTAPLPPPTSTADTKEAIVQGYSIQILGFIPIPKNDLRKQAEVPLMLLDVQDGKRPLADLLALLKEVELKQAHIGKRVPVDKVALWSKPAETKAEAPTEPEDDDGA